VIQEIVARGDKVIASGRRVEERLGDLKSDSLALLELDIGASQEVITAAIQKAWGMFGHIDVLLSNAGMSAMRSVEEAEYAFFSLSFSLSFCLVPLPIPIPDPNLNPDSDPNPRKVKEKKKVD
jgi:NAD(P)-dependent dehydrogenase (short-subunit alcohol dehydrogenase family)